MTKIYLIGYVGYDFTFEDVFKQIEDNPDSEYRVIIDSNGGLIDDSNRIYNYLKSLDAKIVTEGVTRVSSAATKIFLAGEERVINSDLLTDFVIHDPMLSGVWLEGLNADDLEEIQSSLREEEERIAGFYPEKTNLTKDQAKQLMTDETNLTAEQLAEYGFSTTTINNNMATKKEKEGILANLANVLGLSNSTESTEATETEDQEVENVENNELEEKVNALENSNNELKSKVAELTEALDNKINSEKSILAELKNEAEATKKEAEEIKEQALSIYNIAKNAVNAVVIPDEGMDNEGTKLSTEEAIIKRAKERNKK